MVIRFYGAASELTMRPGVSHADLRNASGNTGNVEENKSLYWNPAIYKVVNQNSNKMYQIVDVWFASAYYVWRTGQANAFPNGLKMKASDSEELAREPMMVVARDMDPPTSSNMASFLFKAVQSWK